MERVTAAVARSVRRAAPAPPAQREANAPPAPHAAHARWVVAYSGGLDSTVLLHAAVRALGARRVLAAHVHHGLQPAARAWPAHCRREAAALGVDFECLRLPPAPASGENLEGWAREHRYRALAALAARAGAAGVLTAHHADDQVETVLMRIARGTGIDGLAGIAPAARLAGAAVLRPLLELPRSELEAYARAHALAWIDDPTNADLARTRNAIRHAVLPALEAALPGFRAGLLEALPAVRAARDAQREVAAADLERARTAAGLHRGVLADLPPARRGAALREWLRAQGLRMPSEARLREIDRQLVQGEGAYGRVLHEGVALCRYRDSIFAAHAWLLEPEPAPECELRWSGQAGIHLPEHRGRLLFEAAGTAGDEGVSAQWLAAQRLTVRAGGATRLRLRTRAGGHRRSLKNLYQEHGVPAWLRAALPLVFADNRLLYAGGIGMDHDPARPRRGEGIVLRWQPQFAAPHHV